MGQDTNRSDRVRERTLARVKLLAATAALHAACAGDKPKDPNADAVAGPGGDDDGGMNSDGPSMMSGYAVVDPMPMPSRCGGEVAGKITATALLRPSQKGNDVVVTLRPSNGATLKLGPSDQMYAQGNGGQGAVTAKELPSGEKEIAFLYDGKSPTATVTVPVFCDTEPGNIMVDVTVDPDKQVPNAELPALVRAGYGY